MVQDVMAGLQLDNESIAHPAKCPVRARSKKQTGASLGDLDFGVSLMHCCQVRCLGTDSGQLLPHSTQPWHLIFTGLCLCHRSLAQQLVCMCALLYGEGNNLADFIISSLRQFVMESLK